MPWLEPDIDTHVILIVFEFPTIVKKSIIFHWDICEFLRNLAGTRREDLSDPGKPQALQFSLELGVRQNHHHYILLQS